MQFLCKKKSEKIKTLLLQLGCFARHCKQLSQMPATLPCRNSAYNTRCPDKYFIFFPQSNNNVGWGHSREGRKKIYKLKKKFAVTELSIQQSSAEFWDSDFQKSAFLWNCVWRNEDLYLNENNINGLPNRMTRLSAISSASFQRTGNEFII